MNGLIIALPAATFPVGDGSAGVLQLNAELHRMTYRNEAIFVGKTQVFDSFQEVSL
jgi:hypothetical protein